MKCLAVIVLYKTSLAESKTICGMCAALQELTLPSEELTLMLWDNSSQPLADPQLPVPFLYRHIGHNLGPSGAYNHAMQYAVRHVYTWMHLFDQDTEVTAPFLKTMLQHARSLEQQAAIALIAPTVLVRGFVVSPRRQLFNRHRAYPMGGVGVAEGEAFAINSGSMVRVSALQHVDGFSTEFWLDYSDMYLSHQFYLHGFKLWRAADAQIEHEMTIMDYDRLMTPSRYMNYSAAESAFNDIYKSRLENAAQTLRTLIRAVRQRFKYRNPEFSRIAWRQFLYRMRVPQVQRMAKWKLESTDRLTRLESRVQADGGRNPYDAA